MNHKDTHSKIIKLISGTFISRILGFLREIIISAKFGATAVSDAFFLALQIPVLFRRILGEEMFEKTIMPTFVKKLKQDKKEAWKFLSVLFWYSVILSILCIIFLYALKYPLIRLIAPGITDAHIISLIDKMAVIIIPYLLLTTIYSFLGTIFNFTRRQLIFSIGPAVSNLGIIFFILLTYDYIKELSLPVSFLMGGTLYIIFLIPFFLTKKYRKDYSPKISFLLKDKTGSLQTISFQSFWVFIQAILNKSIDFVDRIIASYLATGSISSLWYARRLEQLPSAIISLSISRAILSNLSDNYSDSNYKDFGDSILYGIKINMLTIMPVTVLMCILGRPISIFMFKRGEFTDLAADMTSSAFIAYGIGLLAMAFYNLFSRAYSALVKNKFTTKIMFISSLLNIFLSIILARTPLKHAGIALASSISFYFASIILFFGLKNELFRLDYHFKIKGLILLSLKLLSASILMGFSTHFIFHFMFNHTLYRNIEFLSFNLSLLFLMGISSLIGLLVYIFVCYLFNIKIMENFHKLLKKNK